MTPAKRDPYGENNDTLADGYAWCDDCGGDGGGEYCAGFSPSLDGPDFRYAECSTCDGTGQVMTPERAALEEERSRAEDASSGSFSLDPDDEIPF